MIVSSMKIFAFLFVLITAFSAAVAEEKTNDAKSKAPPSEGKEPEDSPKGDEKEKGKPEEKEDKKVETKHSLNLGGVKVDYTATAGTLTLKDAEGKPTAEISDFFFQRRPGFIFGVDAHGFARAEKGQVARRWFCRSSTL